jgi:hypothetical protein
VHDRASGVTGRVSVDSNGAGGDDFDYPALCGDATWSRSRASRPTWSRTTAARATTSHARRLGDIRARERERRVTGQRRERPAGDLERRPLRRPRGATDLVKGDTNSAYDVFVHGPYLTLETAPPSPPAGVKLTSRPWSACRSASRC